MRFNLAISASLAAIMSMKYLANSEQVGKEHPKEDNMHGGGRVQGVGFRL